MLTDEELPPESNEDNTKTTSTTPPQHQGVLEKKLGQK